MGSVASPTTTPRLPPRERLLKSATDLFYADGYAVSVDAIAEHADVAKPTVYAHFASKEALIEAVLRSSSEQWFELLEDELERRAKDPVSQLLAPFDLLVADLPDPAYHGCLCVNAAASFLSPAHPAHAVLAEHEQRMLETFEHLAKGAGGRRPGALARQLLLLYDGIKVRGLTDSSGASAQDARAAAKALLG
jgi:AcrR family transcriptional regulator